MHDARATERTKAEARDSVLDAQPAVAMRRICPVCNATYEPDVEVCGADGAGLLDIPDAPLLTGRVLDGRYEVDKVVGTGGMGSVYRAHQRAMERDVAIKVLHPQYAHDPRSVKRFFREAQAASKLVHPNVVTVYDFGRSSDGDLYMVMELLDGWSLGDLIHYRAPLEPPLAVAIALQIAEALEVAHDRRIVHRDLKPDNVQLMHREGGVWVKVLDFGIARSVRDPDAALGTHLSTVEIAGTPAYMSPEQILGKDPDPRSDLYALGILLFEMLTGERPFDDPSSVGLCMRQLNDPPPPLSAYLDEQAKTLRPLEGLIRRLLAKDAEDRPASAAAVRALLAGCPEAKAAAEFAPPDPKTFDSPDARPTRPDAGARMLLPTLRGRQGASSVQTQGPADGSFGALVDRGLQLELPKQARRRGLLGLRAPGRGSAGPLAVACLTAADRKAMDHGPLADWLEAQAAAGRQVVRRGGQATVTVEHASSHTGAEGLQAFAAELLELQSALMRTHIAVGAGLHPVDDGDSAAAADIAKRLAAAGPHGALSVASQVEKRLGRRGRPLTAVFLPTGEALDCRAVSPDGDAEAVGHELVGRTAALKRLGQFADGTRRRGATTVRVLGDRGSGKTSVLEAFVAGRPTLWVTASPASDAWPGHTAARLARRALGLADTLTVDEVRERLDGLPLVERDLLRTLLVDKVPETPPPARALAGLLADLLERVAGDGPLVVVVDDAHCVDLASRHLLDRVASLAGDRPWLFLGGTDRGSAASAPFEGGSTVDLRPLGLRASNAVLDAAGVAHRHRGPMVQAAKGNPLALRLLAAEAARGEPAPKGLAPGRAISALLPGHLRRLDGPRATAAWRAAVLGHGGSDPLAVQAARLYLSRDLAPELRQWLAREMAKEQGMGRGLAAKWREPDAARLAWCAARHEALGLWSLAARDHEAAAARKDSQDGAFHRLQAACLWARAGQLGRAWPVFEAASSKGSESHRAMAALRFGAVLLEAGDAARAEQLLTRAQAALSHRAGPEVLGEIAALRARCAVRRADVHGAMSLVGHARQAVELLRPVHARAARALEALSQEVRAEIAVAQADAEGARVNLRQACDAFRDLGRHADAIRCLVSLGRVTLDSGDTRRAAETFRAAARLAAHAGLPSLGQRARVGLGEAEAVSGAFSVAMPLLRAVLREAAAEDDAGLTSAAATAMARALLARGLVEDARRYAERGLSAAPDGGARARAAWALADCLHGLGRSRRADERILEAHREALSAGDGLVAQGLAGPRDALDGGALEAAMDAVAQGQAAAASALS